MGDAESESVRWSRALILRVAKPGIRPEALDENSFCSSFLNGGEAVFWNRQFIYVSNPNFFWYLAVICRKGL